MTGELLALLVVHLVLTALPAVAGSLVAARLGVRSVAVLIGIGLVASGVVAMLAFWGYYGDRVLGETVSDLALFGSIAAIVWALYGGRIETGLLRELAVPLALWCLASSFMIFFGFLHGGTDPAITMASTRFSHQLPSDNDLPRYFAEWFFENGHHGHPVYEPEWLASDRPPLQSGYVLSQRLLGAPGSGLNYQVLGVVLQQLWVVGLWALLLAARVGRLTRALVMGAVLLGGVAIVNGFFVWPKMLPVAMLLAAAALVVTPLWSQMRRQTGGAVLVAALFALAMLAHGGSIFGVVPLVVVAALRGLPSWRWIAAGLLAGLVLMVPWSAYQHYGEPPGNRLLKYQLAGVPEIDNRGVLETLEDSYGEAGVGGTLHNKAENFVSMLGGGPAWNELAATADAVGNGELELATQEVRKIFFYNLIPSMGLLLLGPLLMAVGWRRRGQRPVEWRFGLTCFALVGIGAVFWGLAMFGNESSRAVMHQGSFMLPVLALCGAVCGVRAVFPRVGVWLVGLSALSILALYTPSFEPLPGSSYSAPAAVLAVVSLVGFGALALRTPSGLRVAASPLATEP